MLNRPDAPPRTNPAPPRVPKVPMATPHNPLYEYKINYKALKNPTIVGVFVAPLVLCGVLMFVATLIGVWQLLAATAVVAFVAIPVVAFALWTKDVDVKYLHTERTKVRAAISAVTPEIWAMYGVVCVFVALGILVDAVGVNNVLPSVQFKLGFTALLGLLLATLGYDISVGKKRSFDFMTFLKYGALLGLACLIFFGLLS